MIGITIKTHTTKAIANEVVAGGSACPPPRPRDLTSVVVVPDEATPLFFNVPGLTRGESAMLSEGTGTSTVASAGHRVAAQRFGGGAEVGLAAHNAHGLACPWCHVLSNARWRKDRLPARKDRLQPVAEWAVAACPGKNA